MMRSRRTLLAATLVSVAVLVPTVAWFITGSAAARRDGSRELLVAVQRIRADIQVDADRLAERLERLRASEGARPFYHYQSLYHDPRGAAQGLAVTPSPLASGTSDPLVWAHFQFDEQGRVSLPTVNDRFPELSHDEHFGMFCELLDDLEDGLVVAAEDARPSGDDQDSRSIVLDRADWEQIHRADAVYATLTGRPATAGGSAVGDGVGQVTVRVGPLQWATMVLGSGPVLVALREVVTPDGPLVQGFAVATHDISDWLGRPLRFESVTMPSSLQPIAPVGRTGWHLVRDAGVEIAAAELRARQIMVEFRQRFVITSLAAVLAGAAVVVLVFQADRLAGQRARFAAAAAHELRTPLSTLQLHSEMLAEGLGDPSRAQPYAERIAAEVRRLGRVVANMLDLSRLERGAPLAHPIAGDLQASVNRCVDRLRPSLEAAGMAVELTIDDDLPTAAFDNDALQQIMDNLLDNAERHTRPAADREVAVRVAADGPSVRVEVVDNGPGLSGRARRTLFEPFDRRRDADGPSGLGLGLAVARSLARAQGGELKVFDPPAGGAGFRLTLPVA